MDPDSRGSSEQLPRARWSGWSPTTVAIQQLNRLQNRNDYLLGDATTGEVRRVFRDESRTWVDVQDEIAWIDNGRSFLWASERDGWRHVYRVAKDGGDADD